MGQTCWRWHPLFTPSCWAQCSGGSKGQSRLVHTALSVRAVCSLTHPHSILKTSLHKSTKTFPLCLICFPVILLFRQLLHCTVAGLFCAVQLIAWWLTHTESETPTRCSLAAQCQLLSSIEIIPAAHLPVHPTADDKDSRFNTPRVATIRHMTNVQQADKCTDGVPCRNLRKLCLNDLHVGVKERF